MALSVKKVKTLKRPGRYSDGHNLFLQVMPRPNDKTRTLPSENRSWLFKYERHGRVHYMGLGPVHALNLEEARARARRARQQLLDGVDPLEARRAERAAQALAAAKNVTFADAARAYHAAHKHKWRNEKSITQWLASLEQHAYPLLAKTPVAAIDTALMLKVLEAGEFWKRHQSTASRVRGRIENVLDWCTVRGYRTGDNPAAWKLLAKVLPGAASRAKHHAALPYDQVAAFMATLRARPGEAARALEFTILTASRTGEVFGATWSEVNLADKVLVIAGARMKGGREHKVPLSDDALALLGEPGEPEDSLFNITESSMYSLLRRMGRSDLSVHGFRATFKMFCDERTSFPPHIVEMCLAHRVGNAVENAYRRSTILEQRRRVMTEWAAYCNEPSHDTAAVVPIRRVRGRASERPAD